MIQFGPWECVAMPCPNKDDVVQRLLKAFGCDMTAEAGQSMQQCNYRRLKPGCLMC